MEKRFVYEFDYNGKTSIYITDEYGIREEGIVNGVYVIFGINGCCDEVAKYPKKQTSYRILKDTLVQTGTNCIEWKEK